MNERASEENVSTVHFMRYISPEKSNGGPSEKAKRRVETNYFQAALPTRRDPCIM